MSARTLVLRDAHVLSLDPSVGELPHGDIVVRDGLIAEIGEGLAVPQGAEVLDASGRIALPGFVDTHRHMFQGLLRGSTPHDTLQDYFVNTLGRAAPAMTPQEYGLGNALSAQAALRSGITTVQDVSNAQDTPEITDALVAGLQGSGLRAVFCYGSSYVAAQRHGSALAADARRVRREVLADDGALVTMSLLTEPGDDHAELANARLAEDLDLRTARHSFGAGSIVRLAALGALRPGGTYIHGIGLDAADLRAVADSEGNLSIAPAIEMMMGHGYPPFGAVPDDLRVTLSVDVEVTCPADMFTQLRAAFQATRSQQLADGVDPAQIITVRRLLELATREGATALGLGGVTGTLTPGKQADVLLLRVDTPDVAPVVDPYSTVVLQCDRSHVDTVLVGGAVRVRDGRSVADTSALVRDAGEAIERLRGVGALTGTDRR